MNKPRVLTIQDAEDLIHDLKILEQNSNKIGSRSSMRDIIVMLRDKIEEAKDDCSNP